MCICYASVPDMNKICQSFDKKQKPHTKQQFDDLAQRAKVQIMEQGLNCALYYDNKDLKSVVSLVPTSALVPAGASRHAPPRLSPRVLSSARA